jgi:hypothetical protein
LAVFTNANTFLHRARACMKHRYRLSQAGDAYGNI